MPDWIARGIVREIPSQGKKAPFPMYFSRMFTVLKKNGKIRPIIDLSSLNRLLVVPGFRMEHITKVIACIGPNLWGVTMDLEDAYFHVMISIHFQKFFAFMLWDEDLQKFRMFVFMVKRSLRISEFIRFWMIS